MGAANRPSAAPTPLAFDPLAAKRGRAIAIALCSLSLLALLAWTYLIPPYTTRGWPDAHRFGPPMWTPSHPEPNAADDYRSMLAELAGESSALAQGDEPESAEPRADRGGSAAATVGVLAHLHSGAAKRCAFEDAPAPESAMRRGRGVHRVAAVAARAASDLRTAGDADAALGVSGDLLALGANLASDTHWRLVATSDLGDSGAAQFYWSPGVYAYDESLVSPLIDATAINGQGAQVGFSHVLDVYSATTLTLALLVSTDGGQSWSEAWTHDSFDADGPVDVGPESVLVDLTPWLPGAADARIAFRIAGDDTYALNGWYVDDVLLLGLANP